MVKLRRFCKIAIFRAFPVIFLLFCLYIISGLRYMSMTSYHEMLRSHLLRKMAPLAETVDPPRILNNSYEFYFNKENMQDENGEQFRITIWRFISGTPGYAANPEECLDNIYCKVTYASAPDAESAHAIVVPAGFNNLDLPKKRSPHQLYTWWTLESPLHMSAPNQAYDGIFNLTMTFKTDADVYSPYGSINLLLRILKSNGETNLEDLLKKKRNNGKVAVWAVSNCFQRRLDYGKSLINAGLKVDTFGRCFGSRQLGAGPYTESLYNELSYYKFYFSFENSITCNDYITEKFWFNGLRSGAIPIVWGPRKSDLLKVAPTKSFIHTSDFSSPKDLVKYLNYLASNETAYAEYHRWRTWVNHPEKIEERLLMRNRDHDLRSFCKLCSIVQSDAKARKLGKPNPARIIKSVRKVWWESENGDCHH